VFHSDRGSQYAGHTFFHRVSLNQPTFCGYNILDIQNFSEYTPATKKEVLIKLTDYVKTATGFEKHGEDGVVFVLLVGKHGWKGEQ